MRKLIWTITALGLLVTAAPANASASKKETIGVGAGGVIGAVAGGPLGFMVGAAIGAKVGDTLYKKDTEIETLNDSLNDTRKTVGVLQSDLQKRSTDASKLDSELQELRQIARPELVSLMQAGIAMDLLFRTDEHVLADTTGGRLAEMAVTLASMPDIQVQLDGFADERGNSEYNQRLSEKRVDFVRELLLAAGVDSSRISIAAHGEAPAQDETVDSFALERRVSLTLFIDNSPSFASNPE
jgi:outer membrane protein OmpA-like peptidoglycan-associated protein